MKARYELKNILKELADKIRSHRSEYKNLQREGKYWDYIKELHQLESCRYEFRHYHIAASLIRGTAYERIECVTRAGEPNWDYIGKLRRRYEESPVCADAV